MVCHERWDYDDEAGVATLRSLAILCHDCNLATHAGMAGRIGRADQARERLMAVNGLSREEAEGVLAAALERWARRSERAWTTTVDPILLDRFPALAAVA